MHVPSSLHLDALFPNFQFIVSCTNDSPTTVHCQITKDNEINCITELINSNTILEGIDDEPKHLLHCNQKVREFMSDPFIVGKASACADFRSIIFYFICLLLVEIHPFLYCIGHIDG